MLARLPKTRPTARLAAVMVLAILGVAAAPAASDPLTCSPRPEVGIAVAQTGQVVVTTHTAPGVPANQLGSLAFGTATNAFIDIPGGQTGSRGNFTVSFAPGTQQTSFWVRAASSGQAVTVPLIVIDNCGTWSTLVGGPLPVATPTPSPTATPTPTMRPSSAVAGATLAKTPTLVSAAAALASTPAANVGVAVAPATGGALLVTISARPASCTSSNQLLQLAFGNDPAASQNAQIVLNGQTRTPPFTVSLPPGTTEKTFSVLQVVAGQSATVPLVAQDSCGQWNTFVGGGANVFGQSVEGVPLCTDHDPLKWHPLVKRDAVGSILCTYGHEHHGNPHDVDDLFGPPGAWWGGSQDISYPWQTFAFTSQGVQYEMPAAPTDPSVYENARKHNGYKWYVKRNLPCVIRSGWDGCFRAFRVLVHSMGSQTDTVARFHSFSAEALIEIGGRQGIVRGGGWMNTGFLGLLVDGGNGLVCPPLDTNPPSFFCPPSSAAGGNFRESYSTTDVPPPHTAHANPSTTTNWYADHHGGVGPGPAVQMWGPTSYTNPAQQLFYPPQYRANNTLGHLENFAVSTAPLQAAVDASGLITGRLYENRHGDVVAGCSAVGLDCIPFAVEHAPLGAVSLHAPEDPTDWSFPSYDVASPITGNSLVTFPN
jgi:hypothetical protein